jgi:iron complex transport system ATP-binding protein
MVMRLDIKDAAFSYNGGNNVFEDITFSIREGDVFCILGPNGTGKSTLIRCINGISKLNQGDVLLDGKNIHSLDKTGIAKKIGYIPQTHNPAFPFSVLDVVLMGRAPHIGLLSTPTEKDIRIAEDAIKTLDISHLIDKPYTGISGGERQLVLIARVLAQQPRVLLLDEPTSHLDFGKQMHILSIIDELAESGLSIIMSSHFPDHAFISSNKVAIMNKGTFIDVGSADDVITKDNLKRAYGVDATIVHVDEADTTVCVPMKNCCCGGKNHGKDGSCRWKNPAGDIKNV